MTTKRLTDSAIQRFPTPATGRVTHWDATQPGNYKAELPPELGYAGVQKVCKLCYTELESKLKPIGKYANITTFILLKVQFGIK